VEDYSPGEYLLRVIAYDTVGQTAQAECLIKVEKEEKRGVSLGPDNPNVFFSPNNDGVNDFIEFAGEYKEAKIYNLQGKLLKKINLEKEDRWDGKIEGKSLPSGVYIYSLEKEGEKLTGTIVIIR
jgi:gliding motility-associated-like protein